MHKQCSKCRRAIAIQIEALLVKLAALGRKEEIYIWHGPLLNARTEKIDICSLYEKLGHRDHTVSGSQLLYVYGIQTAVNTVTSNRVLISNAKKCGHEHRLKQGDDDKQQ
jgi:hypothetical protein